MEPNETTDDDGILNEMDDEPVTYALVMRLTGVEIRWLKKFIESKQFNVIYRTTSYGPLFISRTKDD